jgi:glycerol-3-phosphate dehydrogenase (NAD(P)+)
MNRLAIVGAGGWGTALAVIFSRAGKPVRLWAHGPDTAAALRTQRTNPVYLPGVRIPDDVVLAETLQEVMEGSTIVIVATPSHVLRTVMMQVAPFTSSEMSFVSAVKGIENDTLMRMSEVIADVLAPKFTPRTAVLSGPTFAPEVARGEPAALAVASSDASLRLMLQSELASPRFRPYTNADPIGVEIGAAVKNIIAIAAGVVEGLGLGSNTTAALVTRGLVEITRLAVAAGGKRGTLAGLAGLGDLVLTAYGPLSRNRQVGVALGQGRKIEDITAGMRMVAEGVKTTKSAMDLARKLKVEMPIVEKMYSVLYNGLNPQDAISDLMDRKLREE